MGEGAVVERPGGTWRLYTEGLRNVPNGLAPSQEAQHCWTAAPPVLQQVLAELFLAQPEDVLSWLHQAVWRLRAEEIFTATIQAPTVSSAFETLTWKLGEVSAVPSQYHPASSCKSMTGTSSRSRSVRNYFTQNGTGTQSTVQDFADEESLASSVLKAAVLAGEKSSEGGPVFMEIVPTEHARPTDSQESQVTIADPELASNNDQCRTNTSGSGDSAIGHVKESMVKHFGVPQRSKEGIAQPVQRERSVAVSDQPDCGVLSPIGHARISWDISFFVCLLFEIWATPIDLVYLNDDTPRWWSNIMSLFSLFFVADICLNFFTGYVDKDTVVMRRTLIAKNYLQGWFWVDAVATLPDLLLAGVTSVTGQISSVRVLRGMKFYKMLKALKLVRSARLLRKQGMANKVMSHFDMSTTTTTFVQLLQGHIALFFIVHLNAVLWGLEETSWTRGADGTEDAWQRYTESLLHSYSAFTLGGDLPADSFGQQVLGIVVAIERATIYVLVSMWLVWRVFIYQQDEGEYMLMKEGALGYLKHHRVSTQAQLKVFQSINETSRVQRQQKIFREMANVVFPPQLKTSIQNELWGQRLLTLGIILRVADWSTDFVKELSMVVRDDIIASKVVVFTAGEPSTAAYLLLQGSLEVTFHEYEERVPGYTPGMWVGEKALVNPELRRIQTVVCKTWSELMALPADMFQKLLMKFGLKEKFNALLNEQLWLGLCGRCGVLGDHYDSSCPLLAPEMRHMKPRKFVAAANPTSRGRAVSSSSLNATLGMVVGRVLAGEAMSPMRSMMMRDKATDAASDSGSGRGPHSDLAQFLQAHHLGHLFRHMGRHGIFSLNDLKLATVETLRADPEVHLTPEEEHILSESAVQEFKKKMTRATTRLLANTDEQSHFIFISHYKAEAGSTAALMQDNLVRMMKESSMSPGYMLEAPVFLDSEDLKDLRDLKRHVLRSHNVVLLLTTGFLSRPWCLLEVVTAVKSGAHVLPVRVEEPKNHFQFPEEAYYERLRKGQELDKACTRFLRSEGIELPELERALRQVFRRIAVPFSPHKTANIRKAELVDLLKECRLRQGPMPAGMDAIDEDEEEGEQPPERFSVGDARRSSGRQVAASQRGGGPPLHDDMAVMGSEPSTHQPRMPSASSGGAGRSQPTKMRRTLSPGTRLCL